MKKWQCSVCKYVHTGDLSPDKCPVCGVPGSRFIAMEEPEETPSASGKKNTAAPEEPVLKKTEIPEAKDKGPQTIYGKATSLMIRHHAHPVSVHMPNGILPAAVIIIILAWLFDSPLFVKAGFINLVFVILALPMVLFSGTLEWKHKYNQASTTIFKIKILAASVTTASCLIAVIWYIIDPMVLSSSRAWVFVLLNLVALGAAGTAGHIGGKLVFKD